MGVIKYSKFGVILILVFFAPYSLGQSLSTWYYDNTSIPVLKGNDTISLAWAGGMNHPQFSSIDLDFDGVPELVTFEPANGAISVFKQKKINGEMFYSYVYNGGKLFPKDIKNRLQLYDYNHDGKKDIFTSYQSGIRVYKNTSNSVNGIQWKLVTDALQSTNMNQNPSPIYTSAKTIPALIDIDGDGDMDILSYSSARKIVQWHKNISMETYGNPDSLVFKLGHPCWGDFEEKSSGNGILLHSTINPCGTPYPILPNSGNTIAGSSKEVDVPKHQGGGSILALDVNGDGLMDVLIGDHEYSNLTYVKNGGTNSGTGAEMISADNNFPSYDVPVNLSNFLTGYYEDVNLDSIKDLIVTTTYVNTSDNTKGVWLYKNKETNSHPNFSFVKENFLQGEMIDNGKGSIPVFVDVNNDGLTDLLVANNYNWIPNGIFAPNKTRINYYENIGTSGHPVFQLKNKDWNGFSLSGFVARVAPTFGDLDGDGDKDMIIGLKNGKLYYYENAGGSGAMLFNIAQIVLKDNNGDPIQVSSYATPELFDLNNDGKMDLIIGQGNGSLLYYENIGTSSNYKFKLTNPDLGQLDNLYKRICVPRFYKINGVTYLIIGNQEGDVALFDHVASKIGVGEKFHRDSITSINTKAVAAPAIAQLKADGSYSLVVGNNLGGLFCFNTKKTTVDSTGGDDSGITSELLKKKILIYPNPNSGKFTVDISDFNKNKDCVLKILDYHGKVVFSKRNIKKDKIDIQLKDISSGVYFIQLSSLKAKNSAVITQKFVIQ